MISFHRNFRTWIQPGHSDPSVVIRGVRVAGSGSVLGADDEAAVGHSDGLIVALRPQTESGALQTRFVKPAIVSNIPKRRTGSGTAKSDRFASFLNRVIRVGEGVCRTRDDS